MKIKFDKLYRYDRISEPCSIAIPVKEGELMNIDNVQILDEGRVLPIQKKVTSRHKDGSVRYMFLRFLADLPANAKKEFDCEFNYSGDMSGLAGFTGVKLSENDNGFEIDCDGLNFRVVNESEHLIDYLNDGNREYSAEQFVGPVLKTGGCEYGVRFDKWQVQEAGDLCVILKTMGSAVGERDIKFECKITAYAGKKWVDISYRIINTTDDELHVESLVFALKRECGLEYLPVICEVENSGKADSTGCGDAPSDNSENFGPIYETNGIKELSMIEERIGMEGVRTCVGHSNYKTLFTIGDGVAVSDVVNSKMLVSEANEHFAEVIYGTFFTDVTDKKGGVCATIFQAQQNYPKAVVANDTGVYVMLVPEDIDYVKMASGMSREQKFLLHFHESDMPLLEIDNRSLIYQMPDKPHIAPVHFKDAGVMPDIFVDADKVNFDVELKLVEKADGHARAYGMLNWGDAPDPGYTSQGRGKGRLVWTNNEYDYPHAMYLMYAKTGTRRFLDYANVAASHWMDVDVCHYSSNPLRIGGQWEHTMGHCGEGLMVCSHEWVEGLIDCYHFTGDERALETALGIGENVLRLLETPMYQKSGESNARETGWALRTLVALYIETWDEKWTAKCDWIVGHFKEWTKEYGEWLAPYTDNTTIRVGFMISVAVGSLMRYYRVFKDDSVKQMMINAIDDMVDNCLMETGLFYYKELPSLQRNGNNTLLLEAMTIGYELTGETRYLTYGKKTFENAMAAASGGALGNKKIVEDAVLAGNGGTKNFGQCFIPIAVYYKAMSDNGML